MFWYSFFNLYKIFKVPYFLLDFLFADLLIKNVNKKYYIRFLNLYISFRNIINKTLSAVNNTPMNIGVS